MVMKKYRSTPASGVTLTFPPTRCGFQYADDATLARFPAAVQRIPMIPKAWDFEQHRKPQAFCIRSLVVQLQPTIAEAALTMVVSSIKASLKTCDFLVLKNAALASYADVICVNSLTRELWLIQCKYSAATSMHVSWDEELKKMGYERPSEAADFNAMLLKRLGLKGERFFLCLAHPEGCTLSPAKPRWLSAPNVHLLEHPTFNFGVLLGPTFNKDFTLLREADMWEPNEPSKATTGGARGGRKRGREAE
jgi:hypothetical protein